MAFKNDRGIMEEQKGKNGAAFVILVDGDGVPYVAGGGGGGGGATDLTPLIQRIGELAAAPGATTQLGRLKSLADLLTTLDTDLVSRMGEVASGPNGYTVLGRLKRLEDKLTSVITTIGYRHLPDILREDGTEGPADAPAELQSWGLNPPPPDI